MARKFLKTVALPITTPVGKYCFGGKWNRCCPHFDNEGGYSTCNLSLGEPEDCGIKGVLKPKKCKQLKEVVV